MVQVTPWSCSSLFSESFSWITHELSHTLYGLEQQNSLCSSAPTCHINILHHHWHQHTKFYACHMPQYIWTAVTILQAGRLINSRILFLIIQEAGKSKIKLLADLVSSESPLSGSYIVIFLLCPHMLEVVRKPHVVSFIRALIPFVMAPPS